MAGRGYLGILTTNFQAKHEGFTKATKLLVFFVVKAFSRQSQMSDGYKNKKPFRHRGRKGLNRFRGSTSFPSLFILVKNESTWFAISGWPALLYSIKDFSATDSRATFGGSNWGGLSAYGPPSLAVWAAYSSRSELDMELRGLYRGGGKASTSLHKKQAEPFDIQIARPMLYFPHAHLVICSERREE